MSDDEEAYEENNPVLAYMRREHLVCAVVPRIAEGERAASPTRAAASTRPAAVVGSALAAQDAQHFDNLVNRILESGLLVDEDLHYVEAIRDRGPGHADTEEDAAATGGDAAAAGPGMSRVRRLLEAVDWLVGRALSMAAPLVAPVVAPLAALWGAAVALWQRAGIAEVAERRIAERREQEAAVEALLQACRVTVGLMLNSLTLIREREIWVRRRMLMRGKSEPETSCMAAMMAERCEWMPTLREAVVVAAREGIGLLAHSTKRLIVVVRLTGQVDHRVNYLAHLDLEDLLEAPNGEGSYSTIKRLQTTYMIMMSEHLRRLALSFCPAMWRNASPDQLLPVYSLATSVAAGITRLSGGLNREYQLFSTAVQPVRLSSKTSAPHALAEPYGHLCTKVHDAMHHLKTMVGSVQQMMELFEDIEEIEEIVFFEDLSERLADFEQDINDLATCCQEAAYETHLLSKFPLAKDEEARVVPAPQPLPQRASEGNVRAPQAEYQVEDEVFEGVREDEDEADPRGNYSDQDTVMLSDEELARREHDKWISQSVMRELKLALVVKSKEWNEREIVAKRKKQDGVAALIAAPNQEATSPLLEDDGCQPPGQILAFEKEKKSSPASVSTAKDNKGLIDGYTKEEVEVNVCGPIALPIAPSTAALCSLENGNVSSDVTVSCKGSETSFASTPQRVWLNGSFEYLCVHGSMLSESSSEDDLVSPSDEEIMRSFAPPPPPPPPPPPTGLGDWAPMWPVVDGAGLLTAAEGAGLPTAAEGVGLLTAAEGAGLPTAAEGAGLLTAELATSSSVGVLDMNADGMFASQTSLQLAISEAARLRMQSLCYLEENFEDDPEDD